MQSQETEIWKPPQSARILSLIDVAATAGLFVMIFVLPAYGTSEASYNSQTGVTTQDTGSATLLASNPQAFSVLTGIAALAILALVLTLITAWRGPSQARRGLAAVLIPLSVLTVLGLDSVGPFIAPLVVLGWCVFALSAARRSSPR